MRLYRNDKRNKTVVIGEKELYSFRSRDMSDRGYKLIGYFNSSWDSFSKEFILIWSSKKYADFVLDEPLTEKVRLDKSESLVKSLHTQVQNIKKELRL